MIECTSSRGRLLKDGGSELFGKVSKHKMDYSPGYIRKSHGKGHEMPIRNLFVDEDDKMIEEAIVWDDKEPVEKDELKEFSFCQQVEILVSEDRTKIYYAEIFWEGFSTLPYNQDSILKLLKNQHKIPPEELEKVLNSNEVRFYKKTLNIRSDVFVFEK